jgi:two-component system NarL family sensor kinase
VLRVGLVTGDRVIGSIAVAPPPGRRLRRDEERLLTELGRHAGLAVDCVRLAAEVAAHHRQVVSAREEERRRLGRELHDELGPTVAGLAMQLGALRPLVRTDPDTVVERLSRLEQSASAALGDIRRVAHALRPPVLDQVGLGPALLQVAESLDLSVVESVFDHEPLPAAVELAAYRIAAEALTNVARHATVRAVRLAVRATGGALVLTVEDHGVGLCDAGAAPGGLGLSTMGERAEELGGSFTVGEGHGGGALVTAVLPLEPGSVSASVPGAPR